MHTVFIKACTRFEFLARKYFFRQMETAAKCVLSDVPTIGTHSGIFHCDEALACFMLRQLPQYEQAKILRTRDEALLKEKCDIVVDVGGVFDHERRLYDHHQKTFNETLSTLRPDIEEQFDMKLSSAGLVYTYYGEDVIKHILQRECNKTLTAEDLRLIFKRIYKTFVMEIDGVDNGVPICDGEPRYHISTGLSSRVKRLNPSWREDGNDVEARFDKAMQLVGAEFTSAVLALVNEWLEARVHVRRAMEQAKEVYASGEILLLELACPWRVHLEQLERELDVVGVPKMVVFNGQDGSWRVMGVPETPQSFVGRKFFPAAWRGLRNEQLCSETGLKDLIFVHSNGFMGGASTKSAAIAMAIKSVES